MRHTRTVPVLAGSLALTAAVAALAPTTAQAAVACTETALVAAIDAANTAGGGNVVLASNCTYTITTPHSSDGDGDGPNALPVITAAVTLTGDTDTITRSTAPGTAAFRIAKVAATGSLTLKGNTTLNNGTGSVPSVPGCVG
ncbi:hypothetical protein [Streptomyces sp. NBC_01429]|uniref:hypothetical protein n=1 Tax=Streptomyces sp. NBC_01429 TaxID=2903862 RepID=UPI002E2CE7E0|nr:hypothetical protein [Streptomyces sp. NBC_01429]